ncbi:MAG: Uma2 family endonuclease [Bacillota bacterium]
MSLPVPPAGEIILTYEDYLRLPDDGKRYEILEGVLHVVPSPNVLHQHISRELGFIIYEHVRQHELGVVFFAPLDIVFSRTSIAQPDIIYISRERQSVITEKHIAGAPDLVVEIVSPSTSAADRVTKAQVCARYGVPYYWVVDPEQKVVEEFRLERGIYMLIRSWEDGEVFTPEILPGLQVGLRKLWDQPGK